MNRASSKNQTRQQHAWLRAATGAALLSLASWTVGSTASAQQVNVGAPLSNVGGGFYENIGTQWGANGPGWFFNFGAPAPVPFGGNGGGANFGGGFRIGNVSGNFGGTFGQGADTTMVSQSPSITIPNGGNGYFIDGSFRPFVTSVMPIVGGPGDPSPLREKLRRMNSEETPSAASTPATTTAPAAGGAGARSARSTAERGDLSVAAIQARTAAAAEAEQNEIDVILEKAKGAEAAGKVAVARIYYQMAARRTAGEQQREILTRLNALK
jgi:hypothetical protein